MKKLKKEQQDSNENKEETNLIQVNPCENSLSKDDSSTSGVDFPCLKDEKKQSSRRRKGTSKPRRFEKVEPSFKVDSEPIEKSKSLDSVLRRVLRSKKEDKEIKDDSDKEDKMMKMHETLSMHHHLPKAVRPSPTPPESVESPNSVYSNERPEVEQMIEGSVEPFVKVRPQSIGGVSPARSPSSGLEASLQRSLSSEAVLRKSSLSPNQILPKENDLSGRTTASSTSPTSYSFDVLNVSTSSALAAMAASSMGLPTMIPTNSVMSSPIPPILSMPRIDRRNSVHDKEKKAFEEPSKAPKRNSYVPGSFSIASMTPGQAMQTTNGSPPPTAEMRAQYKRPPHTYPALIASAILDSPGNLITLRGIYEYIMNNFPYYKYCHDKSAWQNSIRHNLSLNQCFVKVPRYENAAKSNYWTMTREGFEEFGNENSFKRRRRRGASLAPISAYRAKKQHSEGSKNNGKNRAEHRNSSSTIVSASTCGADAASNERFDVTNFPPHLMNFATSAVWPLGFRPEDLNSRSRKRSPSPLGREGAKLPRMLVLKQGDGPTLDGIKNDDIKRPNSLSSVEEMQGTLNFFSKTLLDSSSLAKTSASSPILSTGAQPWMSVAQKNLLASTLISAESSSSEKNEDERRLKEKEMPLVMDGVEIGSEITVRFDSTTEVPIRQYRCRFCPYTYVSSSSLLMEQHIRMGHQYEFNNAKSKGALNALPKTSTESQKDSAERLLSIPNMISGLNSRSMLAAAAQTNAQNLLAAAQASATANGPSGFPYSPSFSSGLMNDSVMRSFAEQLNQAGSATGERDHSGISGIDALAYRQQAINNALQQAAAASSVTSQQDQLRMLYQQLALSNSFFANSANSAMASAFPRQSSTSDSDTSNQIKQQIWQQYQQKIFDQMKVLSDENSKSGEGNSTRRNSYPDEGAETKNETSPRRSPVLNPGPEEEAKKSIHGWKQCGQCEFTAKGEHGLDLHYRKAHAHIDVHVTSAAAESVSNKSADSQAKFVVETATTSADSFMSKESRLPSRSSSCDERSEQKILSPAFLTPPLSNSPSYQKRNFNPLDLSGIKEEEAEKRISRSESYSSSSTQTTAEKSQCDPIGSRTCQFCDISFGDDMMHALHMSCHDKVNPFKCTICGQKCNEKYYFNVHLLRGLHQQSSNNNSGLSRESSIECSKSEGEESPRRLSNSSDSAALFGRSRSNVDAGDITFQ